MQQLSGLDATWLYLETETCFLQTGVVHVFEYPDDQGFSPLEATRDQFASRLDQIEPLRRRVVTVPFALDHPYWTIDPDFDLHYHIRHISLARLEDDQLLAEQIAKIISRPLDRSRPLWEAYVIEGVSEDRWALFTKYHHATLDGGAGILLLNMLFDSSVDARPVVPETLVTDADSLPSKREMMVKGARGAIKYPLKSARAQYEMVSELVTRTNNDDTLNLSSLARTTLKSVLKGSSIDDDILLPTRSAPPTPWNVPLSGQCDFAFCSVPLADIKALGTAWGGTINDAVMAACAGGLRRYLLAHDALPDDPLVTLMPVSQRTGTEAAPWTNMISVAMSFIPTNESDPLQRFDKVKQAVAQAKTLTNLVPEALGGMSELANPALMSSIAQLATRWKLSNFAGGPANLTISNVAGPREPMYLSGAQLLKTIPVSLLNEGMGLNVTVLSYTDNLDFGLVACRNAVPDLPYMQECITTELDHLFEVANVRT
ncbi:MAG: wax ester/triacylglycerol synthase family O-acyltransferase [Pseudomonadales bacterium]